MSNAGLSFNSRKALSVQLGEAAGSELATVIQQMAAQIEELQRNKVNVTRIVATREGDDSASEPS